MTKNLNLLLCDRQERCKLENAGVLADFMLNMGYHRDPLSAHHFLYCS